MLTVSFAVSAQPFDNGSDGSYGAMNITADTELPLPPDGVFQVTTMTVASGATLTFTRNALNTPVRILARGDVIIEGFVDISASEATSVDAGRGGPGGFDGGMAGSTDVLPGDGQGPGAGFKQTECSSIYAGFAGHAEIPSGSLEALRGPTYGSPLLIPLVGGSGGGGSCGAGGGGGGGAILISSNTTIQVADGGGIRAYGSGGPLSGNGWDPDGRGSGGAIRLLAPAVSGEGILGVRFNSRSASGYIRIDTFDRSEINFTRYGIWSIGSNMIVGLDPMPSLDIIEVAGETIPVGQPTEVGITLPLNSNPNRTVVVQASNFNGPVPIALVIQPEQGSRTIIEDTINNTSQNPAQKTINVTLPQNVLTRIFVWTR